MGIRAPAIGAAGGGRRRLSVPLHYAGIAGVGHGSSHRLKRARQRMLKQNAQTNGAPEIALNLPS